MDTRPPRSIYLMRHAERLDRAMEKRKLDWISSASRPQDPAISDHGIIQAREVGNQLKGLGISKIIVSPMIRTVMTADIIADVIGLGAGSLLVDHGVVEEAKSFRGKEKPEPIPNWNPLVLPVGELLQYSNKINLDYEPLIRVEHEYDESRPNTVKEIGIEAETPPEVTAERCRRFIKALLATEFDKILIVCHGAITKYCSQALEEGLDPSLRIRGERSVSSWSEFVPVDSSNIQGAWRSPAGVWHLGGSALLDENKDDDMA